MKATRSKDAANDSIFISFWKIGAAYHDIREEQTWVRVVLSGVCLSQKLVSIGSDIGGALLMNAAAAKDNIPVCSV